ncbi:MAG: AarF/ABC1/UbiB kinase family protein [Bacilli bacterium]|nr:AarF/ABC1/UbiB kinase family protein [Bacilli bacterium]
MISEAKRLEEIISVIRKYHLIKNINPESLKLAIEELGPTFVKLGQIMSTRSDLISEEYCKSLKQLCSDVKPMPFSDVVEILNREYHTNYKKLFLDVDYDPIGSASIAQVHRARLIDGGEVVVKVQRKNIYELMTLDVKLLKRAVNILQIEKLFGNIISINDLLDELYNTAIIEMDFLQEKKHIDEFRENNKDVLFIDCPKVYDLYTTEHILVMDYIDGYNIDDRKLISMGYNMDSIAEMLSDNYIKQAIDDGFFHADPHSDNIKIRDNKIIYLDFGMMGRVTPQNRSLLNECIVAIATDDIGAVCDTLLKLDTDPNEVDYISFKNSVRLLLDKNKQVGISHINIKNFVMELVKILSNNSISLPRDVMMLIRGIVVLEGLLRDISPNIDLMRVLKNRVNIDDIISKEKVKKQIINSFKSGIDLTMIPKETLSLIKAINNGEVRFNVELNDSKHQIKKIEGIVHEVVLALLDVSFIIATSIIVMNNNRELPFIFYTYLFFAIICSLLLVINVLKKRR